MANSTYVSLKDEVSLELFEIAPYQENRPGMKSPSHQVTKLVCGLCNIVRPHSDMTQNTMELKNNQTRRTLGTRFVPLEMREIGRSHVVSDQVKKNHSQMSLNVSMSQESSSDKKSE